MPSAARRRAFWAPWSCCSKKESALEAGKNFASFFKSCGVWGQLRPGGTLPSGRPSRQARLAPHGLPTGAASEKSSSPAARREADRPSREPFAQDKKGHPREKLGCPFYLLVGESRSEPLSPLWGACGFRSWSFLTGCAARQGRETLSRALPAFFRESWAKNFPPPPARFFITCTAYTPSRRGPATWRPAFPPRFPGPGGSTAPGRCKRPPAPAPPSRRRSPSPRRTG